MQLRSLPVAVSAGLLFLASSFLLAGADSDGTRVVPQFNRNQRLPLPQNIEVTAIATADRSVWFLGTDRSAEVAAPVVFSWSAEGIRQFRVPGDNPAQQTSIAVDRTGQALLLRGGKLWGAVDAEFTPVPTFSDSPVAQIVAREGFWALTLDGNVFYLPSLSQQARKIIHVAETITATATSAAGDLWYATAAGKLTLAERDGSKPDTLSGAGESAVTALFADANEQLWVSYADGRIARYVGGTADWFTADEGLPVGAARQIAEDGYGNLILQYSGSDAETAWIVTQPRGLRSNLGVQFRRHALDGLTGAVRAIAVDHLGGTWVSVGTEGAFRLQGLADMNWPRGAALSKADQALQASMRAAAMSAAAARLNDQKSASGLTSFPVLPGSRLSVLNSSKGLPKDFVTCIVADNQKNVYFTSGFAGFGPANDPEASAPAVGGTVVKYDHRTFTTLALPTATAYQACAFDSGTSTVWFGGTNGVSRFNPATNAVSSFLSGQLVMEIIVRGSDVFVAAQTGIYRLSAATGQTLESYGRPASWRVSSIALDSNGTLYAGTGSNSLGEGLVSGATKNGVYRWNGSAWVQETQDLGAAYGDSWVQDIEFDNGNNLWVVQRYGSIWRKSAGGTWTEHKFGPSLADGGSGKTFYRAYRINKDAAGNLWLAHYGFGENNPKAGATMISAATVNAATPATTAYGSANGLPNNQVAFVAQEDGAYWFGGWGGGGAWRVGGPFYQPGFPKPLLGLPRNSSPLLVDLDNDDKLDIVIGDTSGRIYAFKSDGTSLWTVDVSVAVPQLPQQVRAGVVLGATFGNPAIDSSAAAGDVDGDGEIEVVIGTGARQPGTNPGQGGVVIISRTGQVKRFLYTYDTRRYPDTAVPMMEDGYTEPVFATPVLANLDNDPELEIVAGSFDNFFYAWNGDGTPVYQRDNDNDGKFDEDGLGDTTPYTPFNNSDNFSGIRFVDDNGNNQIDEGEASDDDEDGLQDEDYPEWPYMARDTTFAAAPVWDINGDGVKEIVLAHDYSNGVNQEFARGGVLRVLNPQGQQIAGFPKGNLEQVIWSTPAIVDLDNDGQYEIIHGTGLDLGDVQNTPAGLAIGQLVYAWRANGNPYVAANGNGRLASVEGRPYASFAVGDLNNDGSPELVIITATMFDKDGNFLTTGGTPAANPSVDAGGQQLYVFDVTGGLRPGFPVRPVPRFANSYAEASPILVDVDNDNFLDIIVGVRKGPIVIDRNGHVLPGMGAFEALEDDTGAASITSTAAVADIDNDGTVELVWAVPETNDTTGSLRAVKLGAANATYRRSWPQWLRTVNKNPIFGPVISVVQGSENAGTYNIRVQAFGARNEIASVVANLSAVGGSASQPLTATHNAYYSGTVNVGALGAGRYHIPVTITDTAGKTDSQTLIYFKRGAGKSLAFSTTALNFGTATQGNAVSQQLTMTNVGNQAMSISSITSNSAEFTANVQNTPIQALTSSGQSTTINGVPFGFSWAGPLMPKTLQPGESFSVTVRFRPNASAGGRTALLTVNSDDSAGARNIALAGTTATGAVGCSVNVALNGTNTILAPGATREIAVTPSVGGCQWTATADVNWLSAFADRNTNKVFLTIYPNLTVQPRTGRINVNGQLVTIYQNGSATMTETQRFVATMYFAFFGRYPSQAEIDFQGGALGANPTDAQKRDLAVAFLNSAEFNAAGKFAAGLYVGLLNRDAEYSGWVFQRNAVATGQVSTTALVTNFLTTLEYQLQHPNQTRTDFVEMLYRQVLLRTPSPAELQFQTDALTAQITGGTPEASARTTMAVNFLNSTEFRIGTGPRLYAFLLYALFLQRDPTPAEFTAFRNALAGGASLSDLVLQQLQKYEARRLII